MSKYRAYAVDVVMEYDRATYGHVFASGQNRTIRVIADGVRSAMLVAEEYAMRTAKLESFGTNPRKDIPATGLTIMQVRDAGWPIDAFQVGP